ncbi:thioesterase [Candidatus Francisella endociliophora]|uniref:Thioesterase n=1 Tax=Candidatus Francisella endociliophora TaxID=653937 RepID=A0A097EM54_9GAMM|nr:thioesterase family protein [Francisella sp. FSC1006]AIT08645.1 thioesterase [Francisella sp. FSC1006]
METYKYITNIRFSDTDKNGHVNNARYFDYFEEARTTWAYENTNIMEWGEESSIHFVIVEQSCKYIHPLLHPNKIEITQRILKYSAASIEFSFELRILGSSKIYTTASVKVACFNSKKNKLERIPNDIKQLIIKNND